MYKRDKRLLLLWLLIFLAMVLSYYLYSYLGKLYLGLGVMGLSSLLLTIIIFRSFCQGDIVNIKKYINALKDMNLAELDDIIISGELNRELQDLAENLRYNLKTQIETSVNIFDVCEKLNSVSAESLETTKTVVASVEVASFNTVEQSRMLTDTNDLAMEVVTALDRIEKEIGDRIQFISDSITTAQGSMENICNIEERISLSKNMIEKSMAQILKLKNYSDEIAGLIDLINSISKETNMLSLNASIEAARAGEQGKGFAVVAMEVGKLANETKVASSSIEDAIYTLKDDIATIAQSMNEEMEYMEENWSIIKEVNKEFATIVEKLNMGKDNLEEITDVTQKNNATIGQITGNIEKTTSFSQEIATHMEETTPQMQEQQRMAEDLQKVAVDIKERVYDMQQSVAGRAMEEIMLNGANYIRNYAQGLEVFDSDTMGRLLGEVEMDLLHITDSQGIVKYSNEKTALGLNLYKMDNEFLALKQGRADHIVTPIKIRVQDGRLFKFLTIIDDKSRLFEVGLALESLIQL